MYGIIKSAVGDPKGPPFVKLLSRGIATNYTKPLEGSSNNMIAYIQFFVNVFRCLLPQLTEAFISIFEGGLSGSTLAEILIR